MSKIIITECNLVEKPGKTPFYACKDSVGNKMSCWDAEIATFIQGNLNKEIEVTLKTAGNFVNIRAVEGMVKGNIEVNPSQNSVPVTNPEGVTKNINVPKGLNLMSQKDIPIVSQCMVKTAGVILGGITGVNSANVNSIISDVTKGCVEAYNEAVLSFEQNG